MNTFASTAGTGTGNTFRPVSAALSLVIFLSACGGGAATPTSPTPTTTSPTTPTPAAPTPAAPTPTPAVTYTLSGVVFEMAAEGRVPVEGVEIYCDSCGSPVGHTFVHTDVSGFYSLAWARNGVHPLFVTKAGYGYPAGTLLDQVGRIGATVNGDTRFDIRLVRR